VLVFTRRRDQAIVIGDGIEVRVLRVGRDGVRLGVIAPNSVPVHRQEVHQQICEANRAAVTTAPADPAERAKLTERLAAKLR
jgi:carbon storage regulator